MMEITLNLEHTINQDCSNYLRRIYHLTTNNREKMFVGANEQHSASHLTKNDALDTKPATSYYVNSTVCVCGPRADSCVATHLLLREAGETLWAPYTVREEWASAAHWAICKGRKSHELPQQAKMHQLCRIRISVIGQVCLAYEEFDSSVALNVLTHFQVYSRVL